MKITKKDGKVFLSATADDLKKNPKLASLLQKHSKMNPCWEGYEMVGEKDKNGKKVPNCVPKKKKSSLKKAQSFMGDPNVMDEHGIEETPDVNNMEMQDDVNANPDPAQTPDVGDGKLAGFMSAIDELYRKTFNQPGGLPSALKQQLSVGVSSAMKAPEGEPLTDGSQPPAVDQLGADKAVTDQGLGSTAPAPMDGGHHNIDDATPMDEPDFDDNMDDGYRGTREGEFDSADRGPRQRPDRFAYNIGKITKVSHKDLFVNNLLKNLGK